MALFIMLILIALGILIFAGGTTAILVVLLSLIALVMTVITIIVISVGGAVGIILFSDVIVCIAIIICIITKLCKKK